MISNIFDFVFLAAHLCANCGKGFKDRSTLKKHVIIHSDEKLFACPECPSRFQRKGNLTTHMAVHKTERYVCNICGTISKSILSFRAHRGKICIWKLLNDIFN